MVGADAVDGRQLLLGGLLDPVDRAELPGQRLGRDRADMTDRQARDDPGQRALLGRRDVLQHRQGVLLRLALLVGEDRDDLLLAGLRVALGQSAVLVQDVRLDGQQLLDGEVEEIALVASAAARRAPAAW